MEYKIGFSKDIHKLVKGRDLILAGVKIPFELGELAHSDGDVVYHAVAESILGALALGDLGTYFPDSDVAYKDIDSSLIVKKVVSMMHDLNYSVSNIDILISLEKPKIHKYVDEMRNNVSKLLGITINNISIKAGTNEEMGPVGELKAVEAFSYVLLRRK